MAKDRTVEIQITGQVVRFEVCREAGIYFAKPYVVSQRFVLPPAYYGEAKTPGKAIESCKERIAGYLVKLNESMRS